MPNMSQHQKRGSFLLVSDHSVTCSSQHCVAGRFLLSRLISCAFVCVVQDVDVGITPLALQYLELNTTRAEMWQHGYTIWAHQCACACGQLMVSAGLPCLRLLTPGRTAQAV
jgi:hypothetical protein